VPYHWSIDFVGHAFSIRVRGLLDDNHLRNRIDVDV
jgi:hypothetical protein